MADSVRKQIVVAVAAALAAGSPPGTVYRARTASFEVADLPAFNIYPLSEECKEDEHDAKLRVLRLRVTCEVKAAAVSDQVDDLIDPLTQWVTAKLQDQQFNGLAEQCQEVSTEWTIEAGNQDICGANVEFEISYRTARADQTVSAE
jgi:hypothetical protein